LTGLGAGGVWSAVFPIAAELMPAQHRRTYGAIYEMALASSFTVLPFVGGLLAGNPDAFRLLALPGGLAVLVVPAIVYFLLPESPRWHLRRGEARIAVDIVNQIIRRSGNRVAPLTGGSSATSTKPPARSCRPTEPCSRRASCGGPQRA
jgi:MFS family permease